MQEDCYGVPGYMATVDAILKFHLEYGIGIVTSVITAEKKLID